MSISPPPLDPARATASAPPGAADALPVLHVRTLRIEESADVLGHLPAGLTAAWLRHGQGLVGVGAAWALETAGPDRFRTASVRFQALCAQARIDDEVGERGTALIAFGSFSYAADSARPSRLLVPRAVLGSAEGSAFLTLVGVDEEPEVPGDWRDLFPTTPSAPPAAQVEVETEHTSVQYQALVGEAIERIRAGEADKVVLSESTHLRVDPAPPVAAMVRRLAAAYPSTWTYHLGDVLGASPEMLADTDRGRVFSRVLAGSRPVADGAELAESDRRAFRADPKERSEHAYAIDSVTSRLADLTVDLASSPEPFVLRLPGIEHLASDVSGHLRQGVSSLDVAGALHPSAAVSGSPREAADAIIARLEDRDRGGYAAPVGWMDARGDGQWAIALRMAHLEGPGALRAQAGGGIVEGSDPVLEHAEAIAKTRPILRAVRGD